MIQQICDARAAGKAAGRAQKRMLQQSLLNQLKKKLDNKKKSSKALSQMELDLVPESISIKEGRSLRIRKVACR
jgi:hypothetical protein